MGETIPFDEFKKLDLRVVKVVEATDHPNADKLIVLKVDIGGGETRQIVAGIRGHYEAGALAGRSAVMLVNLQPAQIRGIESQGMLLAASQEDQVVLLAPDRDMAAGSRVS